MTEPERYVDRAELARLMGVSLATIDRMVRDGMPSETWGRRTRRFLPSEAMHWARLRRLAERRRNRPPFDLTAMSTVTRNAPRPATEVDSAGSATAVTTEIDLWPPVPAHEATLTTLAQRPFATVDLTGEQREQLAAPRRSRGPHAAR